MKKIFNNADTLGVIRLEFQRIFTGWNFYAAVIVTTALVLYQTFSKNNYAGSVISGLVKMSALSFICRLMTMSSAFPAASSYCDDCIGKYYKLFFVIFFGLFYIPYFIYNNWKYVVY